MLNILLRIQIAKKIFLIKKKATSINDPSQPSQKSKRKNLRTADHPLYNFLCLLNIINLKKPSFDYEL